MGPELHQICQGSFLPEEQAKYLEHWANQLEDQKVDENRLQIDCIHRGEVVDKLKCPSCQGGPKPVHSCNIHGRCVMTPNNTSRGAKLNDCFNCEDAEGVQEPPPALSITMCAVQDWSGAWATISAILMYHSEILDDIEILVGDNDPETPEGKQLEAFCRNTPKVRYFKITDVKGSSLPKDRIIRKSRAPYFLHLDSHVMVVPGAIKQLMDYFNDNPDTQDLLMGPILHRPPGTLGHTHQDLEWRGQALGIWARDERGVEVENDPFEIPQQGTGLMAGRVDAWQGYNENFKGYGGNETLLMERYRQDGHKVLCMPFLRWAHRFDGPHVKKPYNHDWSSRYRNYAITFGELGWSRKELNDHYEKTWGSPAKLKKAEGSFLEEFPLVQCVIDEFDQEKVDIFLRQDYPNKKLRIRDADYPLLDNRQITNVTVEREWDWSPKSDERSIISSWLPTYDELLEVIKNEKYNPSGAIFSQLFNAIRSLVTNQSKTLEFGSGLSTLLFDRIGSEHTALESDIKFYEKLSTKINHDSLILSSLNASGFYEFDEYDGPYDLILVDGPLSTKGHRHMTLSILPHIIRRETVILVDDTHRPADRELAVRISDSLGKQHTIVQDGIKSFAVIK